MVEDHLGNKFNTIDDMCERYSIDAYTYERRLEMGWSLSKILSTSPIYYIDHLGNEFRTLRDLCNKYNIIWLVFYARRNRGLSIKSILTDPLDRDEDGSVIIKDHLGNTFKSLSSLCKKYDISLNVLRYRLALGWTLDKALTYQAYKGERVVRNVSRHKYEDHLGNKFDTLRDMCEKYNIDYVSYRNRVKQGWDLEKILTTPVDDKKKLNALCKKCKDHLGREFDSKYSMCKHYGISVSNYNNRLKLGWTLEETLTTPIKDVHRNVR